MSKEALKPMVAPPPPPDESPGPPPPPPAAKADPKTGKLPFDKHLKRWGGVEYPSASFVQVKFLKAGSLGGERWQAGERGSVPKAVFDATLKPQKIAVLYVHAKPPPVFKRPATDVGNFRRR